MICPSFSWSSRFYFVTRSNHFLSWACACTSTDSLGAAAWLWLDLWRAEGVSPGCRSRLTSRQRECLTAWLTDWLGEEKRGKNRQEKKRDTQRDTVGRPSGDWSFVTSSCISSLLQLSYMTAWRQKVTAFSLLIVLPTVRLAHVSGRWDVCVTCFTNVCWDMRE